MKHIKLGQLLKEEIFNLTEDEETGLLVIPSTSNDKSKIQKWLKKSGYHAEWNREGYFFFPEEDDSYDNLERALTKEFTKINADVTFEGI